MHFYILLLINAEISIQQNWQDILHQKHNINLDIKSNIEIPQTAKEKGVESKIKMR